MKVEITAADNKGYKLILAGSYTRQPFMQKLL